MSGGNASADTLDDTVADKLVMDDEFIVGISEPTAMAFLPDGRVLVTERSGQLVLRRPDGTLSTAATFEVNSGPGEQGLLNVLPHPDFEDNHLLYFYYSASDAAGGSADDRHRVSLIELGDDGLLDMSTERVLVADLMGPANHNGGGLSIHGDYLFIGTGDTGNNSNSRPGEGLRNYYPTCLTNAQGKVLRVHLDGAIPSDNPLVGQAVTACGSSPAVVPDGISDAPREEIFAWGLRNAWRLWADPQTGNVWVGNVGEITFEMLQVVPPSGGLHFGWPYREGNQGLGVDSCRATSPDTGDCVDAVYVCEHNGTGDDDDPDVPNDCESITAGLILNDCQWPAEFEGRFVFGDYDTNNVWTLPLDQARSSVIGEREPVMRMQGAGPVDFREHAGALYVVGYSGNGHVTRIAPAMPEPACDGSVGGSPDTGGSSEDGGAPGAGPDAGDPAPGGADQSPDESDVGASEPTDPADDDEDDDDFDPGSPPDPGTATDPDTATDVADAAINDESPSATDDEQDSDATDGSADAAASSNDATEMNGDRRESDDDCGCRTVGVAGPPAARDWLSASFALAALVRRRRRHAKQGSMRL